MIADMSGQKIKIDASGSPIDVLINGEKYEVFCEYKAKDREYRNVYVKTNGNDVIVFHENKGAIVGLFSTEQNKLKELFDYIETTVDKKLGFECYDADYLKEYLKSANEKIGRAHV